VAVAPKNNRILLDASALIAGILLEEGADAVAAALETGADICSVNLAEAITRLQDYEYTPEELKLAFSSMNLAILPFSQAQAVIAATLRPYIKSHNLSLGDRACLAVALESGCRTYTTDKIWAKLPLDLSIFLIR
jgi:PIN domain nuclease of toxin-antitoxin system